MEKLWKNDESAQGLKLMGHDLQSLGWFMECTTANHPRYMMHRWGWVKRTSYSFESWKKVPMWMAYTAGQNFSNLIKATWEDIDVWVCGGCWKLNFLKGHVEKELRRKQVCPLYESSGQVICSLLTCKYFAGHSKVGLSSPQGLRLIALKVQLLIAIGLGRLNIKILDVQTWHLIRKLGVPRSLQRTSTTSIMGCKLQL